MTIDEAYNTCFGNPYIVPIDKHEEARNIIRDLIEEVKQYRKIGTVEECKESVLDIEKAYNKGYADGSLSVTSEIRNNVIDDFVCYMCNEFDSKYATIEEHTGEYVIKRVHSIAEELKAGVRE